MRFGPTPLAEALGAVLAHAVTIGERRLKKGRVLDRNDLADLASAGIVELVTARLDPGDVPEDRAATRAAAPLTGAGLRMAAATTGRVNLLAEAPGLLLLDRESVDRLNRIDEAITLATLSPHARVASGQIVATIKVIPYAAPEAAVRAWEWAALPLRVAPFQPRRAALIQTLLPGLKQGVLDKTVEITRRRLGSLGSSLIAETRVAHHAGVLAEAIGHMLDAGADLVLIAGASAIIDRRDVIPSAIEAAGGAIGHFGMPVDPGNLMLVGRIGAVPVLGLPGCARSPALNGFDWVLERLVAGLEVTPAELMGMGVGGLLAEIPNRGLPRASTIRAPAPKVAALVLAAGKSSRMGANKLLIEIDGAALVERAVDAALASRADTVIVVTGHQGDQIRARLADRPVRFVDNPDYAEGLSTSLKAGLGALPGAADAILVCLGDMPAVGQRLIDRLIAAFDPARGHEIVVPVLDGRRGNPVLWARRFLPDLLAVSGDMGAKQVIQRYPDAVAEIAAEDDGVLTDIDTPEALAAYRARP